MEMSAETTTAKCVSCPRCCQVERPLTLWGGTPVGFCRSPIKPVLSRAGLHHWEEPVLSGSRGAGTVFFTGCNLRCVYCQNYNISHEGEGCEVTVGRLREIYGELAAQGAHNIDLVTPTHFIDAVLESLEPPPPLPVVWNSNGYESPEVLRRLEGHIDIYLPDLKYADDTLACRYSSAPGYFDIATAAIREMFRQTGPYRVDDDGIMQSGVIIRHLILPGAVQNSLDVIRWVAENFRPGEVFFSLMRQYLPCGGVSAENYPELNRAVSDEEYAIVENYLFESGIEDGFVQDAAAASDAFIPVFDGSGVQ